MRFALSKRHTAAAAAVIFTGLMFVSLVGLGPRAPVIKVTYKWKVAGGGDVCHGSEHNGTCEDARLWASKWQRPAHIRKVMGLVFFGRRATVSILDCYLKRNLRKNGGVLDGVIFLERTQDAADLALLAKMVASEPDYVRATVDPSKGFDGAYDQIDDDVLYVKMDDDIVYVEDTALPAMVHTKATRPDVFIVAANVVNQPLISWIHWNLGVVRPYLPELDAPAARRDAPAARRDAPVDWRASRLPSWEGPDDFSADEWESHNRTTHRWLPRRARTHHVLDSTPIARTTYDASGPGWFRWQVGAQEHYSLLEHLENNDMWRYRYHLWDFQYLRVGIQCIAIMGSDINAAKPIAPDDEQHFAVTMPERLGRHAVADGRGVVAHFSFNAQSQEGAGMRTTDILERYRAYAKENVCKGPMLWTPEEG